MRNVVGCEMGSGKEKSLEDKGKPLDNLDCQFVGSGDCRGLAASMSMNSGKVVEAHYSIIVPSEKIISGENIDATGPTAHVLGLLNRNEGFICLTDSIVPVTEGTILALVYEVRVNQERRRWMLGEFHPGVRIHYQAGHQQQLGRD